MSEKKGKITLAGLTKGGGSSNFLSFRFSPESEEIEEILQDNPSSLGAQGCSESAPASPKPSPGDVSPLKEYFIKKKQWAHKWDKKSMSLDLDLKGKIFTAIEDKKKSILSNFIPEEGAVITQSQSIPENIATRVYSGVSDEIYQSSSLSCQGATIKENYVNEFRHTDDFESKASTKSDSPGDCSTATEVEEIGIDMTNYVTNASSTADIEEESLLDFFIAPENLQELFGGLPTLYQPTNIISGLRPTPLEARSADEVEDVVGSALSSPSTTSQDSQESAFSIAGKEDLSISNLFLDVIRDIMFHPWAKYWIALVAGNILLPLGTLAGFFWFLVGGLSVAIIGRGLTGHDKSKVKNGKEVSPDVEKPFLTIEPMYKELKVPSKSRGWMTQMDGDYDVATCHLRQTRVVFVRLDGPSMYFSYPFPKHRIPKRRLWNDPIIANQYAFARHESYNISGATISIVPDGLAKKRVWNKKYPIGVTFPAYSVYQKVTPDPSIESLLNSTEPNEPAKTSDNTTVNYNVNSSGVSVSKNVSEVPPISQIVKKDIERLDCSMKTVYLFARCDREKDDWYRRLVAASKLGTAAPNYMKKSPPDPLNEYKDYMKRACPALIPFFHTMTHPDGWDNVSITACEVSSTKSDNNSKDTPSSSRKTTPEKEKPPISKNESVQSDLEHINTIEQSPAFLNALIGRLFFDFLKSPYWNAKIAKELIDKKLFYMKKPAFIEVIKVKTLDMGSAVPTIERASAPLLDHQGLWIDLDISYEGTFTVALETHVNLLKLRKTNPDPDDPVNQQTAGGSGKGQHNASTSKNGSPATARNEKTASSPHPVRSRVFDSDADDSGESSEEEDQVAAELESATAPVIHDIDPNLQTKGQKTLLYLTKFASSALMNTGYVKKMVDNLGSTPLVLSVELKKCVGTLAINIPPPPNDRIWLGFRTNPTMEIVAKPKFGDRTLNLSHLTDWIKKKILLEFQRVAVCPNMNDITIPLMEFDLPK